MELKSMKLSASERSDYSVGAVTAPVPDEPSYPYGLCIYLDKSSLEKLGISMLPQVGQRVTIHAAAYVKSVSQTTHDGGEDSRSVDIQITDLSVGKGTESISPETVMYKS